MAEKITKDWVIGDVLKKYPGVANIMLEHGLHCVGCHAKTVDTIEAGSKTHGLDDKTIASMVAEMNKFVSEKKAKPKVDAKLFITDIAASKIKELMKKDKLDGFGLRVAVMPGGCSGFMYQMGFEKAATELDSVLEVKGVKFFVDSDSVEMLAGAEIDYVDELNESGFKINNPNAKQHCGCGKSFHS